MTVARKLISFKSTRFCRVASPCRASPNTVSGGRQMAFKILRKNFCGLDVHKTWIFACIGITDSNGRTEYKQSRFFSFTKGCMIGLPNTIAWASAWNPRRNAGFPYSISLKRPAVSLWPTPNTQSRRRATKPTARTPSESATCICAAWSSPALYHRPTSTSFGT